MGQDETKNGGEGEMTTDVNQSVVQLLESVNRGTNALAETMKTVAPEAWRITVQAVVTDAVVHLAISVIVAVVLVAAGEWMRRRVATIKDEMLSGPVWLAIVGAHVGALVTIGVNWSEYLPRLLNPQYYAATDIMNHIIMCSYHSVSTRMPSSA